MNIRALNEEDQYLNKKLTPCTLKQYELMKGDNGLSFCVCFSIASSHYFVDLLNLVNDSRCLPYIIFLIKNFEFH